MQRKGDDPSMKGDVPAGWRGRMTSTRATCRAFRSMRRSNAAGEPQGGADIRRQLRTDYSRQPQRAIELSGGGGNVRERQRGMGSEAARVLLTDSRKTVVYEPAQRD